MLVSEDAQACTHLLADQPIFTHESNQRPVKFLRRRSEELRFR